MTIRNTQVCFKVLNAQRLLLRMDGFAFPDNRRNNAFHQGTLGLECRFMRVRGSGAD